MMMMILYVYESRVCPTVVGPMDCCAVASVMSSLVSMNHPLLFMFQIPNYDFNPVVSLFGWLVVVFIPTVPVGAMVENNVIADSSRMYVCVGFWN